MTFDIPEEAAETGPRIPRGRSFSLGDTVKVDDPWEKLNTSSVGKASIAKGEDLTEQPDDEQDQKGSSSQKMVST